MSGHRTKILAHSPGMGKTLTSLVTQSVLMEKNKGAIGMIIAPKSARAAYKKELQSKIRKPYALVSTEEKNSVYKPGFYNT